MRIVETMVVCRLRRVRSFLDWQRDGPHSVAIEANLFAPSTKHQHPALPRDKQLKVHQRAPVSVSSDNHGFIVVGQTIRDEPYCTSGRYQQWLLEQKLTKSLCPSWMD